jgi:hypothetical protein
VTDLARYGNWTVISYDVPGKPTRRWLCRCDCGRECVVFRSNVVRGTSRSCVSCASKRNALRPNHQAQKGRTHGATKTPEFISWTMMQQRCLNPNDDHFADYGGRGITFAAVWQGVDGFKNFLDHVGLRPTKKHTIDRIDVNLGYEPGNVRWATVKEQANNRRNTPVITYRGVTKTLSAWAETLGVSRSRLWTRIYGYGWSVERALTKPIRKYRSVQGSL